MALRLRALITFLEDLGSNPDNHMTTHDDL